MLDSQGTIWYSGRAVLVKLALNTVPTCLRQTKLTTNNHLHMRNSRIRAHTERSHTYMKEGSGPITSTWERPTIQNNHRFKEVIDRAQLWEALALKLALRVMCLRTIKGAVIGRLERRRSLDSRGRQVRDNSVPKA